MTFSDLLVLIPSLIAVCFMIFIHPLIYFLFARLFIRVWPLASIKAWAMSGVCLDKLPDRCPFVDRCSSSDCRCWTCPRYHSK